MAHERIGGNDEVDPFRPGPSHRMMGGGLEVFGQQGDRIALPTRQAGHIE
jgi:hypothetical protein